MEPAPPTATFTAKVVPSLRSTVFITGAFCTAWAWCLADYGASHAWVGENPLKNQLSFVNQPGPQQLVLLLLQYLLVCGGAAALSHYFHRINKEWSQAAVTAVEFFPSPVFAGKLMGYLSQFSRLGTLKRAAINLAATWFCASLAHLLPVVLINTDIHPHLERYTLQRFPQIVQDTLGFGLGIAWNVLLSQFAAPEEKSSWSLFHFIGLLGYLVAVTLIAFRLKAIVKDPPETVWDRQIALLSFAFDVVCAFTLVAFLNAILPSAWFGSLVSLVILFVLSATMSALVASVDLNNISEGDEPKFGLSEDFRPMIGFLSLLPCVWCCCPWIPLLWISAGTEGAKEQWYPQIAMVSGLAASIEASSILTATTNTIAAALGICDTSHCKHKWLFVLLQVIVAVIVTVILIPAIAPLGETRTADQIAPRHDATTEHAGERQSLLHRFRETIRRGS